MSLKGRDLISIDQLTRDEILEILELGKDMYDESNSSRENSWRDALHDRTITTLFIENSTRTRYSLEAAGCRLGGNIQSLSGKEGSSLMKNETLRDTVRMFEGYFSDALIMRHPLDGSIQWVADVLPIPVISGGDGKNEHPTQALLDLLTIHVLHGGKLEGTRLGLGGDLANARTIGSLLRAISLFDNVEVHWATDDRFALPSRLEKILQQRGVPVLRHDSVEEVLRHVEDGIYYMTRIQTERIPGISQAEVNQCLERWRITTSHFTGRETALMHPLPVDGSAREIEPEVASLPNYKCHMQARMGVFARQALLLKILGTSKESTEVIPFSERLHPDLFIANNRLSRDIKSRDRSEGLVRSLDNGIVIDHLDPTINPEEILHAFARRYIVIDGYFRNSKGEPKRVYKTTLPNLTEREFRLLAQLCPSATFNNVRGRDVAQKFVYLLCQNPNCVTRFIPTEEDRKEYSLTESESLLRAVYEAVPPKFYNDSGQPHCRYCRHPVEIGGTKVTAEERARFIASLPTRIEPVVYTR